MRFVKLLLFVFVALSASCSDEPPPPAAKDKPPVHQPSVFDTQLKALDKAKSVQDTVDKQKRDADKKMEDAGG
jgi:outer membrane biosynthesis protein TonB